MSHRSLANQLLASFGRLLTVEGLQLGQEDNSCVLLFDDSLAVTIEYDEAAERLVFSAYLDTLGKEITAPLLRELLSANFYWIASGGATLCMESATGAVHLMYASSVTELDDARFERAIENLLTMAESWRNRIAAHRTGAATEAVPAAGQNGAPASLPLRGVQPIFG